MWCLEWVWLGGEGVEEGVRVREVVLLRWLMYKKVDGVKLRLRKDIWLFLVE